MLQPKNIAYLSKIIIYPIKSLDGISFSEATILKSGALKYDRQWAIFDDNDRYVNGKRNSKIYQLRALFDQDLTNISLQIEGNESRIKFNLSTEKKALETWLSDYFGFYVHLKENQLTGFPDDTKASGPTIISNATLTTISEWFPHINLEEIRRRLRANLEINGVPPFWEDQLFGNENQWVNFRIGEVFFQGINPCQRCIVPTKNSHTGEIIEKFQQQFIEKRKATLPSWVNSSQFNHFYRVSVNTKVQDSEVDKVLKVGDKVEIIAIE
ncbi:MOSC domain-containing protein [Crocosphaera sp. XPORK-15E]|uniref:MOSC domain-containing protein n=1 Tax=Crocosphaera sp. XPORK-15E TaxID=3110247 RepID=UPI002B206B57|nr:MOSC N-terminal beta barrel domain-containing protein [Crocosphaera sp. XPORK-15E]MEA5535330.1 MOSC N-terminal beta barrel domain-containing protein [Crocosphaera sp. XPORK-15E]